jgi:PAS domain S-box-containing protein
LFEYAADPILIHDVDHRILAANEAACQLFGCSRQDLWNRTFHDLCAPEMRAQIGDRLDDLFYRGEQTFEVEMLRGDSGRVPVEVRCRVIERTGRPAVLSILRDITARKEAEKERERLIDMLVASNNSLEEANAALVQRNQQLKSEIGERERAETDRRRAEDEKRRLEEQLQQAQKLQSIGRLAGGVAHDFNNILTGILGYIDLLGDGAVDSAQTRETVAEIRRAAERAARITQQLLAFSRRQMVTPRVVDLNVVIGEASSMLKRLISEDVYMVFRPKPNLGRVRIDVGQLEQILVNLAVNARDAMPDGGILAIDIDNVTLTAAHCAGRPDLQPGDFVRITVADTGVGIDREALAHIFEPFFTTKEFGKGTGLGLSTVYGIVQQNGGLIEVQSTPGVGTTFHLYFPRIDAPVGEVEQPAAALPPLGTETVLIVEDEDTVRNLACRILSRQGYQVIEARDGEEALQKAQRHTGSIDLVLTDVVMPRLNGRQMTELLAEQRSGFKVLFMSGYTEDVIGHHGLLDETIHFLAKPFTIESLAGKVREVLDRA